MGSWNCFQFSGTPSQFAEGCGALHRFSPTGGAAYGRHGVKDPARHEQHGDEGLHAVADAAAPQMRDAILRHHIVRVSAGDRHRRADTYPYTIPHAHAANRENGG